MAFTKGPLQLLGIQDQGFGSVGGREPGGSALLSRNPEVEEEIGGVPHPPGREETGSDDVGIESGKGAVPSMEEADVVPDPGEGEPEGVRALLQGHLILDEQRG